MYKGMFEWFLRHFSGNYCMQTTISYILVAFVVAIYSSSDIKLTFATKTIFGLVA